MEENIIFVSYLRKGLSQYIQDRQAAQGSRASIDFSVDMAGKRVASATSLPERFSTARTLSLVGPADVKQVKTGIISHVYPAASKTQRFNSSFMPYMEFYEGDFPWRYTPLAVSNGQCTPWLLLVAAADDEFQLETKGGKMKVKFNLTEQRYAEVFPDAALHNKLAHVQLEQKGDEDGVSRLLCGSKIEDGKHVTVFLLPAFETGRRSALGESYDGVALDELSWTAGAREFPVYYHWSYYTDMQSGTFEKLANKLDMTPDEAYNSIKANLAVDITESGLADDGLDEVRDLGEEYVIDVPAALNLAAGDAKNATLREESPHYRASLKDELSLNAVFVENATNEVLQDEDPWVVPPVYGARHLLSENLDGNDVVTEVNLNLKHRVAAGMGASVVKENQETFVHRAWQKVEKINELNQELREYFQMKEVEQKAEGRLANAKAKAQALPSSRRKQLVSDALPRALNSSKLTRNRVTVNQVYELTQSPAWQPAKKINRVIGITPDELSHLFNPKTWKEVMDSEQFSEQIANQIVDRYKQQYNWMQYLLMPYYNKATDPQKREICSVKPPVYDSNQNHYLISPECTELFSWLNGWIDDDAHTVDYYLDTAFKGWMQNRSLFDAYRYNADSSSPIEQVVYPLTLHVEVNNESYCGYVMDAELFRGLYADKPFVAFEYNQMSGASVSNKKEYVFLFPSDYKGLTYRKSFQFTGNGGKTLSYFRDFEYEDGVCKPKPHAPGYVSVLKDVDDTLKPFSNSKSYGSLLSVTALIGFGVWHLWIDPVHPNRAYIFYDRKKFCFETNGSMGITLYNGEVRVNKKYFRERMMLFSDLLIWLDDINEWMTTPSEAYVKLSSFREQVMGVDDFNLSLANDERYQLYQQLYERLVDLEKQHRFDIKGVTPEPEPEEPAAGTPDLEKEKQDTIETLIKKYGYTEDAQVDDIKQRIEANGLMRYPVMVYPDFLDPTFFYLRELSADYVVPSAGELAKNTVTLFQNNPAFEEAFLMGMNTEMGQELLWREYPTDQRGSYFRKFWVSAQLPNKSDLETQYFDIKKVHEWDKPLGQNHTKNDALMLVFAIKGELMQVYPKTVISLTRYTNQILETVAQASMTAWLTEDTYLVGFEGITKETADGLCLTFQEDVTSLQFEWVGKDNTYADSAELALHQMNTPSVFLLPINQ